MRTKVLVVQIFLLDWLKDTLFRRVGWKKQLRLYVNFLPRCVEVLWGPVFVAIRK